MEVLVTKGWVGGKEDGVGVVVIRSLEIYMDFLKTDSQKSFTKLLI